jgi:hypothetical protein
VAALLSTTDIPVPVTQVNYGETGFRDTKLYAILRGSVAEPDGIA